MAPTHPPYAVPYLDAFMLRNFSSDAPLEGRSSFAVEMTEMRCAEVQLGQGLVQEVLPGKGLVQGQKMGHGAAAEAGARRWPSARGWVGCGQGWRMDPEWSQD